MFFKNVAGQRVGAQMLYAANAEPYNGLVYCHVIQDGVFGDKAQATALGSNGYFEFVPTAAQTNSNTVTFQFSGIANTLNGGAAGIPVYQSIQVAPVVRGANATMAVEVQNIINDAVTAAAIATAAIDADSIATDAITAAKIAADAIGSSELATDAIGAAQIATGAIDAGAIATDAITAAKIAASALDGKGDWNIGKTGYDLNADQSSVTVGTVNSATVGGYAAGQSPANSILVHSSRKLLTHTDGFVNTGGFTTGAIDAAAIATGAIDADAIATDAITAAKIAADAIGASEIAAGAFEADAFAANSLDGKGDWNIGKTGYDLNADQSAVTIGTVNSSTVGGYAAGQSPANLVLVHSTRKILSDISGYVNTGSVVTSVVPSVTVGGYDAGQSPANLVLIHSTRKLLTDVNGYVNVAGFATRAIDENSIALNAFVANAFAANTVTKLSAGVIPERNVALSDIQFLFVDETDHVTPETTGVANGFVSKDGAAFGNRGGSAPTHVGNGIWQYDATAADMDGAIITFRFTLVGADDTFITIRTTG